MSKQRFFPLWLILVLAAGRLSAAPSPDEKFYAQGVFLFNVTTEASTTDIDFDEGGGLAAYVGYRILPQLLLEAGGVKFDPVNSFEVDNAVSLATEFEATGYTVGIRGIGTFYDLFDFWGGVGVYRWDSTLNYEINYQFFPGLRRTGSNSNSGEDVYLRLGASTALTDNITVSLEISQFELNDFFSGAGNGNTDFKQRTVGLGIEAYF